MDLRFLTWKKVKYLHISVGYEASTNYQQTFVISKINWLAELLKVQVAYIYKSSLYNHRHYEAHIDA